MRIEGSTALVTGANRGLGRHLAQELLARGAHVYAAARNPASVDLPGVTPVALDVTDPASVAAAADATGDVTLLVNNAGSSTGAALLDGPLADIELEMNTHFYGTLLVTRAFAPQLAAGGGGGVLNVLSALSWLNLGGRRRVRRGQGGGVVADQRPAPAAGRPGHAGHRAARGLHGHRHDPRPGRAQDRPGRGGQAGPGRPRRGRGRSAGR